MLTTLRKAPHPFRGTDIHTFPNGLTVILKADATIPVTALQIWARCGAVDETPNIYGISHGLEHMVFKGTPSRSAGEITREIEGAGGSINAATQLETTHYYIDIPSYSTETALDVLADTILHPTFPQDELERERLVILEEIHRRDDSPDATLWDEFVSQIFQGSPYGIKVIGSKKTVSAMSREDLHRYFQTYYVPSNLSVVVVGDINKRKILKRCHRLFDEMPKGKNPPSPLYRFSEKGKKPLHRVEKPVQLSYFAMGCPSVGLGHPDSVSLDVLADVLAGGASSRLYQRLREERQLVLSLSCDFISFQHKGIFAFFGESFSKNIKKALEQLKKEIRFLEDDALQQSELDRAKARIKSEWLYGSETPHGQASTLGSLSSLGRLNLIDTYLRDIENLKLDDLARVWAKYLKDQSFYTTIIDPK